MGLSKYPVESENCNTYKVDIFKSTWGFVAEVFIEKQVKGWFGKTKTKFKSVHGGSEWFGYYGYDSWGYDFVKMARHAVKEYEDGLKEKERKEKELVDEYEKFQQWDGKCL